MENDFLLEIGTEEMPFSFLPQTIKNIQQKAQDLLASNRLSCRSVKAMGTPRRLTLFFYGLEEIQSDLVQEISGPPCSVAFDKDGKPTKALEKFCARYGASPDETSTIKKEKGEYVCLKSIEHGKRTEMVLKEILPPWILSLSFPKSMRWGDLDIRFVRPIRWLVAIYGETIVEFQLGDLTSSSVTYGHRFHNNNKPVRLAGVSEYQSALKDNKVVLDPQERHRLILDQSRSLAKEVGGHIIEDEDLIQILVSITEYPLAIRGGFNERFLELPEEVLIATMKDHQKYFSVRAADTGRLLPYFIAVTNLDAPDMTLIQKGNEKVLRARLEDAGFFFEEDTKIPLEQNLDALKQVIFHKKLGTSYDKVQRIQLLAEYLGRQFCLEDLAGIQRAALLCKADLVSEMVGEFPELQGVMGGIYAAHSGELPAVAQAIREHYWPVSAEAEMPESLMGALLSLADKMDTVAGFFSIGTSVTGTSDPFGLRRRVIGIIRILLDKGLEISLSEFIQKALEGLDGQLQKDMEKAVEEEIIRFFHLRYHQFLLAKGFPHDTIEAVLSREFDNIPDLYKRLETLHGMRSDPDFEKLILGCKRTVRLLEQAKKQYGYERPLKELSVDDLHEEVEKNLFSGMEQVRDKIKSCLATQEYLSVLQDLVSIKDPVDRFFDDVMVLVDDDKLRENRLNLLYEVADLFRGFADFSKILL